MGGLGGRWRHPPSRWLRFSGGSPGRARRCPPQEGSALHSRQRCVGPVPTANLTHDRPALHERAIEHEHGEAVVKSRSVSSPGTRGQLAARIGAVAWVLNAAQFLIVQLIVAAGWRTPYSWQRNNISDLGNVHCRIWDESRPRYVCSPLHNLMNTSFAVQGVLLLIGVLLTGLAWGRGAMAWTARVLCVIGAGGWVLVGAVPADVNEDLHVLGALLIMGLGNIGLLCAAGVRKESLLGRVRAVTLGIAATGVLGTWMFFARYDPGIGLGGMERVAAFAPQVWTLVIALILLLGGDGGGGEERRGGETAPEGG
ncbi:DUF998 domain-containing protein [Streptomyces sp. NPDC048636]|uniref:DUF998 domain-containing protein n=1 Tax=Streptomyces sp. NPDC048636 TaxID=3155762 RepID=UPI00341DA1C1